MKYAVVTICNDTYFDYAKALINSFFYNNKWFDGDFVVLYDNRYVALNQDSIRKLEQLNDNVKCLLCDTEKYDNIVNRFLPLMRKTAYKSAVLKYELFNLEEYDKLLFLDADIIVAQNIKELFLKDIAFGAASDDASYYDSGKDKLDKYFNTGVFFLGNRKYNNEEFQRKIISFSENLNLYENYVVFGTVINNFHVFDQDIFNVFFCNEEDTNLISNQYNTPFNNYVNDSHRIKINNNIPENEIKIIHYWTKPNNADTEETRLWKHYHKIQQKKKIICLMTSWTKRIKYVRTAIEKLLDQTVKPDEIWLTLSSDEFVNKEKGLPSELIELIDSVDSVHIYWTKENTKTIKKIFPIINNFNNNDIIINCDDDIDYPRDIIELRLKDFETHNCICPITSQNNSVRLGIQTWASIGIYTKKMINGWEKILNKQVILTYEDDAIMSYLFALNGYKPIICSSHNVWEYEHITNEFASGTMGLYNPGKSNNILDKRVFELYGYSFDDIICGRRDYYYLFELDSNINKEKHYFTIKEQTKSNNETRPIKEEKQKNKSIGYFSNITSNTIYKKNTSKQVNNTGRKIIRRRILK